MRFIIISVLFLNSLFACSVCYGSPDEPAVKAAQAGILFLLGVIGFVLSCFALFMYNLNKKSQKV
tara:strand:- start:4222 stop:4416 length:195 start_codon:yes stop_codon:yes gene_type:complete